MGLDLMPFGRAKPGHEAEWEELMKTVYAGEQETEEAGDRRLEISITPYDDIGVPRVGYDPEANAWVLARRPPDSGLSDAEFLEKYKGHYVTPLVENCDGLPAYSNAGDYDGIDKTSFRGSFLKDCEELLGQELLERAWTRMMKPAAAVTYGRELLAIADRAEAGEIKPTFPGKPKYKLVGGELVTDGTESVADLIDILRAAGRWYVFWAERGHPIWGWS